MKPEELRIFVERELDAIFATAEKARLPLITDAVLKARRKLREHLRLAIVGRTKAGKSTLLNALLKISELPMGDTIVTGNVSVLMHIDKSPDNKEMAMVHLDNGTGKLAEESITLMQYRELVDVRKPDTLGFRDQILWFDVYLNHPILKEMSIIDTPGDDSWLKTDSENTKKLFRDKDRKPDVILYVVQKEFGVKDIDSAKDYLSQINGGKHRVSGLNVIAVYSCCDLLIASDMDGCDWDKDFREEGNRVISNNRNKSSAFRSCFSKCIPIAGIFAMASRLITPNDFAILQRISMSRWSELFSKIFTVPDYSNMKAAYPELYGFFGNDSIKDDMFSRLGLEAMKYTVWWCGTNSDKSLDDLKRDLEEYSNVPALRRYVFDEHFKKLSLFYKAICVLPELRKVVEKEHNSCIELDKISSLRSVLELCQNAERKLYSQYGFLSVLRDYYDGSGYFDEEEWSLVSKTIDFCLSDNQDMNTRLLMIEQWRNKADYYNIIGNQYAIEASEKLLKSLNSNNENYV